MNKEKIEYIVEMVHRLCKSLNLFEGYTPKKTEGKTQEALFWRDVVNMYGLFCDCDRIQIREWDNLFLLFHKYSLISKAQYQNIKELYETVSALRAWFCHNCDQERYYVQKREVKLQQFLRKTAGLDEVCSDLEELNWKSADIWLRNHFEAYLDLLVEVLEKIEKSDKREQIRDEWCKLYAKALSNDRELLDNVLAENCEYYCVDQGIPRRGLDRKKQMLRQKLAEKGYSYENIHKSIVEHADQTVSASELVRDSIAGYGLEHLIA